MIYANNTSNQDQVVFTTIPYDVYYYEVIRAPSGSDLVGKKLTVNLPRKPITLPVERGYYNAHNGSAPDIDSTVLTHTLGDPLSYPSSREADLLIASGNGEGLKSMTFARRASPWRSQTAGASPRYRTAPGIAHPR